MFAIKAFLIALDEVTIPTEAFFIEPVAHLFDFGVLALFFLGLVRE